MTQHKTVDRRKAATDAQSVARRLAAQKEKQERAARNAAPAAHGSTGTYYSPREYGAQNDVYAARVDSTKKAMEEHGQNLGASQREVQSLYEAAKTAEQAYQNTKGKFRGASAAQYERQMLDSWTTATRNYADRYQAFQKELEAYQPYEDAYKVALGEYNDYVAQEQADYAAWRATVRSADEIRKDRQEIRGKLAELERLMRENNRLNDPGQPSSGAVTAATVAGNEARIRELQEYLGAVGERERLLEEELEYSEYFRFEDLRQNGDFAQRSRYDASIKDAEYDWVNNPGSAANVGRAEYDRYNIIPHMNADEIAMYNYVYAAQGAKGAKEYLRYLEPVVNQRRAEETEGLQREFARQHPVAASGISVLLSPVSGISSAMGMIAEKVTGQEIDPNSGWYSVTNAKNTYRDEVGSVVEENWGPVGSFGYDVGMGMLDMLADKWTGIGLAGGGSGSGMAIKGLMGSRAVAETVIDGKNRGLSDEQAIKLGLVSGAAELITEGIGLDEMLKLPKGMEDAGFWRGALKGFVGEAGEEGLTNLANLAADISIAGDKSEFARSIERYKSGGMDDAQALKKALADAGISLGLDMLGGGISGGVFGGVDGWRSKRAAKAQQKKEEAAGGAAGEATPSVSEADSSPIPGGTGEPLRDGRSAVPYERNAAPDNGTTAPDDGTAAPNNGTTAPNNGTEPVAGVAAQAGSGDVQKAGNQNRDGVSLERLKQDAVNRRNPLISGVMQTAQDEETVRRIEKAATKTEVTALDRGLSQEDTEMLLRIREYTGREIIVEEFNDNFHAYYDRANDEIHVAADSKNIMASSFGHELTHSIEKTNGWKKLLGLVQERTEDQGQSWEKLRQEKIRFYAGKGQTLTADGADAEIVARYVEQHLLTDENAIRQLVKDDRSVARRILDWLDGIWAKVAKTKGAKEREFIRNARECYRDALAQAGETRKRRELQESMKGAYADGDDDAGDAAFDELYAEDGSLLKESGDFDPEDDWMLEFSFAGENAKGADREALERAKQMERDGDGIRKIFRETGWFRGADRKWRFEIDDSGMKYHKLGDAQFSKDHPEYVRYMELEMKFIEGTISADETAELMELHETWGREYSRLLERVTGGSATLGNLIEHDALFEQYPALANVRVRFADLGETGGYWSKANNEIVLHEKIRKSPEPELLHEIQHAIQDIEGFASGASPEYWEARQNTTEAIHVNDHRIEKAQKMALKAIEGIDPEVVTDFWYAANMEEQDPEGAKALQEKLEADGYEDAFGDYYLAMWILQEVYAEDNPKRSAMDLYRSTAGEIEARDAANRRHLDAGARKNRLPDTGDERTVFVEGSGRQYSIGRTADNKLFVDVKNDILAGKLESEWTETVKEHLIAKYPDGVILGRNLVSIDAQSRKEMTYSKYTRWLKANNPDVYRDKLRASDNADELLRATTGWVNEGLKHERKDKIVEFARGSVLMRIAGNGYSAEVIVGKEKNGKLKLYDIVNIVNATINEKETDTAIAANPSPGADRNTVPISKEIVTDSAGNVKQYSMKGEENGFTEGWHDDDEAARAAQMEGYPVLNGIQVVPMKTWVRARDYKRNLDGSIFYDRQGNPVQYDNYGLVAGLGDKPGTLKINFHNKNVVNEETGQTIRRDNVQIAYEDLTPTPSVFSQTDEDFDSLIGQAPEEPGSYDYSEEELAEIEELRSRASMEEDTAEERPVWTAVEPEKLSGKERDFYDRAKRKLAEQVAQALDVPRQAKREFLEPIAQRITEEYLRVGTISQELRNQLFEEGWKRGIVVDREFYDTYKEVKDYLRTTGITLSETDRDSRDWAEFRKRSFGTLRLVNEGGLPVDTAWGALQEMAPALFPGDILNPEDQLRHMYEVGSSIQKVERSLDEFYGPDARLMKQASRNDFEVAVQNAMADLRQVKRVADERAGEAAAVTGEEGEELTAEAVMALYPKLKETRRAAEKAVAKNLLTKQDKKQVQRLLRGDIRPEHLDPKRDNAPGILAVYEAKKAFEEAAEPIRKWNRQQKAKLYAQAEEIVSNAGRIVDKKRGFMYSRETLERNLRDIFRNREAADRMVEVYAKPVHEGSANTIRMKNRYRERVKALSLSRKVEKGNTVSEAYAVQFYGEVSDILRMMEESKHRIKKRDGKTYLEWKAELQKLWEENPSLDKGKIEDAAREFGKIYEELFDQMNEVRVRNGYEPINHRRGYFPHFQQDGRDGIMGLFGKALGIDVEVQQLPTTINGLTHTFKPGIRWFGNALERKGFDTAYDAVEGFDRYIEGVADVVHHTDNIQRLRALANQIRYRTSDEGLREQIRKIQERTDLSDEEKDALIREKTSEGKFELSNFVVELDEYTNLLANKKSRADRNMEQAMGRDMYNLVKGLEGRVAANMVAINPGSWLTNFIPIAQGWACLDTRMMLKGMRDTVMAVKNDDGIVDESDFLTGRQGSDPLVQTSAQGRLKDWTNRQTGIKKLGGRIVDGSIMEWIDGFTAGTLVRARLHQNLAQGMSRAEAMSEANEWTAGVMADRTKGAMPTVFHRSNPLTKLFTQFQLEVNNQLSYLFKDIPREKRDKAKKELALALLKFAIGAWLYNEAYEFFFGRRPALDVADMAFGFAADVADPELDFADALMGAGEKIAENTPFIGGLLGGGRVPISSALPNAENLVKAIGNKEWSAGKRLSTAAKELAKPAVYMLPPFGGGQIKKIWEGLKMIAQGGSYTVDAEGNPMLQYPLYSTDNAVQKALEAGQAMVFGKTTIRSGREWVEGGFGNLSAEQTATYQALIAMDVEQADAFELLTALRSAEKTDTETRTQVQRDILRNSGLEGEALATVYYDLMVTAGSKEKAVLEDLMDAGADMGKAAKCLMDMKDAADSNGKRSAIMGSGLDDGAKQRIYQLISEERNDDIEAFREAGMDMDDFLEVQNQYTTIKDSYEDESDMATAFARWVNGRSYTKTQKDTVRECFKYWRQMPVDPGKYDRAVAEGLDDEQAFALTEDLNSLEKGAKDVQKWRVAIDNSWSEEGQLQMLRAAGMEDAAYAKCEAAWNEGIAPAAYVRAQEIKDQFDSDGNGRLTNEDWTKLINSLAPSGIALPGDKEHFNLTNVQMGFLWQMLTGSKSTKNNPFSAVGGEKWLAIKNADK